MVESVDTYEVPVASLSLFAMSILIPVCRGVTISGVPEANEILIMGDIEWDDIHCAVSHILNRMARGYARRSIQWRDIELGRRKAI
jgi:hypothetical protein